MLVESAGEGVSVARVEMEASVSRVVMVACVSGTFPLSKQVRNSSQIIKTKKT